MVNFTNIKKLYKVLIQRQEQVWNVNIVFQLLNVAIGPQSSKIMEATVTMPYCTFFLVRHCGKKKNKLKIAVS